MTDEPRFPSLIFIPLPTAIPFAKGIDSPRGPYGIFISCRGLRHERYHIQAAAQRIGISYGEFIRRTTMDAASYVLDNIPEQD